MKTLLPEVKHSESPTLNSYKHSTGMTSLQSHSDARAANPTMRCRPCGTLLNGSVVCVGHLLGSNLTNLAICTFTVSYQAGELQASSIPRQITTLGKGIILSRETWRCPGTRLIRCLRFTEDVRLKPVTQGNVYLYTVPSISSNNKAALQIITNSLGMHDTGQQES